MQVFKCKMCGGTLNIEDGATIYECEFCGSKQTLPKLNDEKRANLYDRANHFRRMNDYDKAMGIYEMILNEDKTDAEAYWSILLCKYGIEYVEDPTTHKRVPTINRTQYIAMTQDEDYKSALKYADGYQREIYQEEAKEIDKIQKGILEISGKEKPFDVFICYKETDHSGQRTKDSVLAQELYYNLEKEGFKVFFSRITLEEKLGSAYEPYIFAGLNSSKVMVVIGSKREYLNAVWVKNEWSRYLSLIRKCEKKTLIPAYKDMDPYDLPEEFSHLQAQDMNKLGFMQDLVHGIKKIVGKTGKDNSSRETIVIGEARGVEPLIRRAYMFLEDADFESAKEYGEKILDVNPECAEAYFIKLLAGLNLTNANELLQCKQVIDDNGNYKKALRFADEKFAKKLEGYRQAILENIETKRKEDIYRLACTDLSNGYYFKAFEGFSKITDYKDSAIKVEECKALIETERKEGVYNNAIARVSKRAVNDKELKQTILDLQSVSGYKNADEKIVELQARLDKYYYDKKVAEEKAKIRAKKIKKAIKIGVPSIVSLALIIVLTITLFIPLGKYNKATELLNSGNYKEAIRIYRRLDGFSNSENKIDFIRSIELVEKGAYEKGIKDALELGAKVNLTYELDGGEIYDINSVAVASTMSNTTFAEQTPTETQVSYAYNNAEEFSGLKRVSRTGCLFIRWELVSHQANVKRKDNELNLTFRAIWDITTYKITYDLYGGSVDGINPSEYHVVDETFTLINPTKTGYNFMGWSGGSLSGNTMEVTIEKGSYGNRYFKANWQAKTYKVTYDANGGQASKTQDLATYDQFITLATVYREGYDFLGWKENGVKYSSANWTTDRDVTLVADWAISNYRITYNLNGGTGKNPTSYTIYDTVTLAEPTRAGCIFLGWTYIGQQTPVKEVSFSNSTGAKIFTANWQVNEDTPYKVEYYFENVNDDNYSIDNSLTLNKQGCTDTPAETAEVKPFEHFKLNQEKSVLDDNINGDGSTVLKVYYDRNVYTLSLTNSEGGTITNDGDYKYGTGSKQSVAVCNLGYNFLGWYDGEELLTTDATYTFTAENNAVAKFEEQAEMADFYFTATATTCKITGLKNSTATDLVIPSDVTSINDRLFENNINLKSVKFNNNLNSISNIMFLGCIKLETVVLPTNLESIGDHAFASCRSLTDIEIPNSVTSIGKYAFASCRSLTDVEIPNNVTSIGERAFYNCLSLTDIEIPNSITSIGDYAFAYCRSLTSIEIPSKVASLGECTFIYCDDLTNVKIQQNVESLPNSFVRYCPSLTSIEIPSSVTSIGAYAFGNCSKLTSVDFSSGLERIGEYAFSYTALTSLSVPEGLTTIPQYAFIYCKKLATVTIPSTITSIGYRAFDACDVLVEVINKSPSITVEKGSTDNGYVGRNALSIANCVDGYVSKVSTDSNGFIIFDNGEEKILIKYVGAEAEVSIPNTITTIYQNAFSGQSSLKSVEIPTSVKNIGDKAFYNCTTLKELKFNAIECTVGEDAFTNAGINGVGITLTIGKDVLEVPAHMCYASTVSSSYKSAKVVEIAFEENAVCQRIGAGAFNGCKYLVSVSLAESIKEIETSVFNGCSSLTSIIIPSGVTYIGPDVFKGCDNLIIYCRIDSLPSTWNSGWNPSQRPIIWEYAGK